MQGPVIMTSTVFWSGVVVPALVCAVLDDASEVSCLSLMFGILRQNEMMPWFSQVAELVHRTSISAVSRVDVAAMHFLCKRAKLLGRCVYRSSCCSCAGRAPWLYRTSLYAGRAGGNSLCVAIIRCCD